MCGGPIELPPVIDAFQSDKDIIGASGAIVLSWEIDNDVNTVRLIRNGVELESVPSSNVGTYTVNRIYESTTFVLSVNGDGGSDSETLTVDIYPYPPSKRFLID